MVYADKLALRVCSQTRDVSARAVHFVALGILRHFKGFEVFQLAYLAVLVAEVEHGLVNVVLSLVLGRNAFGDEAAGFFVVCDVVAVRRGDARVEVHLAVLHEGLKLRRVDVFGVLARLRVLRVCACG